MQSWTVGTMLAQGGRLVLTAARRQLCPVTVTVAAWAADWPVQSPCRRREDARNMVTKAMDSTVDDERRRQLNRILYRSKQRGYLELDLILGQWATDHVDQLDDKGLSALVEILEEENPDLMSWLTGQVKAPKNIASNPVFSAIHKQVLEKLTKYSSIETRAQPGQPWVRGWDDNQKVRGPPVGNQ